MTTNDSRNIHFFERIGDIGQLQFQELHINDETRMAGPVPTLDIGGTVTFHGPVVQNDLTLTNLTVTGTENVNTLVVTSQSVSVSRITGTQFIQGTQLLDGGSLESLAIVDTGVTTSGLVKQILYLNQLASTSAGSALSSKPFRFSGTRINEFVSLSILQHDNVTFTTTAAATLHWPAGTIPSAFTPVNRSRFNVNHVRASGTNFIEIAYLSVNPDGSVDVFYTTDWGTAGGNFPNATQFAQMDFDIRYFINSS